MNGPAIGWALAGIGLVGGYLSYGWPGVLLALTVVVFWLLLQFSRSLRVLREAGSNPIGEVANAVMLNARLQAGMRLPQVLALTKSLGRKLEADGARETWAWRDGGGDEVEVQLADGRVVSWQLRRAVGGTGADLESKSEP